MGRVTPLQKRMREMARQPVKMPAPQVAPPSPTLFPVHLHESEIAIPLPCEVEVFNYEAEADGVAVSVDVSASEMDGEGVTVVARLNGNEIFRIPMDTHGNIHKEINGRFKAGDALVVDMSALSPVTVREFSIIFLCRPT